MNNRTRNRLIGIITILLVIMLLFPYVLKQKSFDDNSAISLTVPTENSQQDGFINNDIEHDIVSDVDNTDIPVTIIPSLIEPDDVAPHSNNDMPTTTTSSETISSSMTADKNYSIQLVALKNKQKIEELVALLRLHNYNVYTDPKTPIANQINRLFIGPYSSKEQAELVILDLKNLTKLQGFIVTR